MANAQRTPPLHQHHLTANAHFGAFAGWEMPLRYAGTLKEHAAVRQRCGIFDVSHLGIIDVVGTQARDVVMATFTNDASTLAVGEAQYTLCLDDDGYVIDDLIVYCNDAATFRAIPNAANTPDVLAALETHAQHVDAHVRLVTGAVILAIQGPTSAHIMDAVLHDAGLPPYSVTDLAYMTFHNLTGTDVPVMISRTGYTGEYGFEIVTDQATGSAVWDAAVTHGAEPCGLAARDTLRLEMGYPLHGHELDRRTTPLRRNVAFAIRQATPTFTGADALRSATKPAAVMRGVQALGRRPLRENMTVFFDDTAVGTLCSGGVSPSLNVGIGLGMIADHVPIGANVTVDVRGSREPAIVVRPPFVAADPRRLPSAP